MEHVARFLALSIVFVIKKIEISERSISNITLNSSREQSGGYDSEETKLSTHMDTERVYVGAISTASSESVDATLKFVIIGYAQVGKSSILLRLMDDAFSEEYISTIGIDFRAKLVDYNDKTVKCVWWDTAGQERFRNVTTSYYRGCNGFIVVYDVTNQKSFDHARDNWLPKLDVSVKKILVGCKSDSNDRVVGETNAQKLAESFGMPCVEVSAKTGSNITKMTDTLVDIVMAERDFGSAGCVVDDLTFTRTLTVYIKISNNLEICISVYHFFNLHRYIIMSTKNKNIY